MADNRHDDEKRLPWPEESDPANLGAEFADPNYADDRKLGEAFADPNSLDDRRIGESFEETNSTAKKKKPPIAERIHKPTNRKPLYIGLIVFAVLFVLVLLIGGLPKLFTNRDNDKRAKQQKDQKPVVEVARVERATAQAGLALPGTTIPLNEAFVYARANGYLKSYAVDIGDHVKKNQLLAVIDAPDLDAQVQQAREQVKQAQQQLEQEESQLALATVTVERYRVLVTKGVFSRQQGDQQEANFRSEQANVAADERNVEAYKANLSRVLALQSYEYVRSPFDGVITQRNVDTGALISAAGATSGGASAPSPQGQTSSAGGTQQAGQANNSGSSGSVNNSATSQQSPGSGGPLFGIAQVERLRILVSVPEGYAPFIHTGQHAQLSFQEYAGAPFDGIITRTADSVDQNTRTMLTEVQVDNHANKLLAGMYVVATFPPAPGQQSPLVIPGDAVVVRGDVSTVAVIRDGAVHMVPITIGRDFGDVIEVMTGLQAGDVVATNVTDEVAEGAHVQVQMEKSPQEKPTAAPPQNTPPGGSTRYSNNAIVDSNLQGAQQQTQQQSQGKGKDASQKSGSSESKP